MKNKSKPEGAVLLIEVSNEWHGNV